VAAGPLFNFLFAIGLIAFIHVAGIPIETAVQIGRVLEHSAAAEAGLQSDDKVLSLDGQKISRIEQLKTEITSSQGRTLDVQVERQGQTLSLPLTPRKEDNAQEWRIGVELRPADIVLQRTDPLSALGQGVAWTWRITSLTFQGLGQIITGTVPASDSLAGPLGIAREIGRQADRGWRNVVFFTAGISISLGILNLLPIPVLDGGHLLFFMIEIVKGGPLSVRKREIAQQVGLLILVSLMIFAFYNDIMHLFS
jgi:regulator of sigma E protease